MFTTFNVRVEMSAPVIFCHHWTDEQEANVLEHAVRCQHMQLPLLCNYKNTGIGGMAVVMMMKLCCLSALSTPQLPTHSNHVTLWMSVIILWLLLIGNGMYL